MLVLFYNKISLLSKIFFYDIYDRIDFTAFKANKLDSIGVGPKKREKDLTILLLRLIISEKDSSNDILVGINEGSLIVSSTASLSEGNHRYWQFVIDKKRSRTVPLTSLKRLPVYCA